MTQSHIPTIPQDNEEEVLMSKNKFADICKLGLDYYSSRFLLSEDEKNDIIEFLEYAFEDFEGE